MNKNVLLVFNRNKEALVHEIMEILYSQVFKGDLRGIIDREYSVAAAERNIRLRPYDMLIVDKYVPADGASISVADDQTGFEFVKYLEQNELGIPSIIVIPERDDMLAYNVGKLQNCWPLSLGQRFCDLLVEMSKDIFSGQKPNDSVSLSLEIHVADGSEQSNTSWMFKIQGTIDNEIIDREGLLQVDAQKIKDLKERSADNLPVLKKEKWEKELKRIGRDLFAELFQNNWILSKPFLKFMAKIVPEKQFRFKFKVGKTVYPVLLEALFEEDEGFFWMLRYPICRQVAVSGEYHQLFMDRSGNPRTINCLIIKSDVHEYVDRFDARFQKLYNIEKEADFLNTFLSKRQKELGIGTVTLLEEPDPGSTFSKTLCRVLSEESYHLVHYAGHSYYDADAKKGYIILPGEDYPEVVDIEELSIWLRKAKTQFVFLSSCHSSEEDFVFELASKKIPAILGFRWDIDDERASEYAESFYRHLFHKTNSLEYALLEARKEFYDNNHLDPIWAAPMLVLQTSS